jgi:hypothetical protein
VKVFIFRVLALLVYSREEEEELISVIALTEPRSFLVEQYSFRILTGTSSSVSFEQDSRKSRRLVGS